MRLFHLSPSRGASDQAPIWNNASKYSRSSAGCSNCGETADTCGPKFGTMTAGKASLPLNSPPEANAWRKDQSMKFSKFIPAILSAAVIFSAAPPVSAGITYDQDSRTADIYLISGEIKPGDGEKFRRLVQKTRHKKYPAMLLLDSVGGNLGAAYAAMKVIIRENMSTVVLPGSRCYSACFILFIAGNPRVASKDASLGVHRASRIDGEDQSSKGTSMDMNEIYKLFKVPANIRLAMLETPPSEMYLLTQEDKKNISTARFITLCPLVPAHPTEN